jgi:hypothetical protein
MKSIIAALDGIADELENKGLHKLAESVDVISNSLENSYYAIA